MLCPNFFLIHIMATYNYLYLVNRLCHKLNEVELTSSSFASATGVYQDFMESVNAAIADIYQQEDHTWPFGYQHTTFNTTIGTNEYNAPGTAQIIDWDSFYIEKTPRTPSAITTLAETATVTDAGHPHKTGDNIYIKGANQTGYNGNVTVTVLSSSQFTYIVPTGTVSPATGTILIYPAYTTQRLTPTDYIAYLSEGYLERDGEAIDVGQYGKPALIVRKSDNNFIITSKPDRIYTIAYDYYVTGTDLSAWNDVPVIPESYKETVVLGAMYHAYLFRDNTDEADRMEVKFEKAVNNMRRSLIPQQSFMRIDKSANYGC